MTLFTHLRARLHAQAGLHDAPPLKGQSFDEIKALECSDGFHELMDNRIVMGRLRYGPISNPTPPFYDLGKARAELDQYAQTGNTEHLVNAANYCRLEFKRGKHPRKHWEAKDRA